MEQGVQEGRPLLVANSLEDMLESSRKAHRHNQLNTLKRAADRGSNAVPGMAVTYVLSRPTFTLLTVF
jgi:hypothetical protein